MTISPMLQTKIRRIKTFLKSNDAKAKLLKQNQAIFNITDENHINYGIKFVKINTGWKVLAIAKDIKKLDKTLQKKRDAFTYNTLQTMMNYIYADQTIPPYRELLQNSIDAGATRIDFLIRTSKVKFKNSTKDRITESYTIDDGEGMDLETIIGDLLIPTISSKRKTLFYRPEMAITKKTVEKIGVFGVGFFSFLGIMNEVIVLTKKKNGNLFFVYIDVPLFFQNINDPDYANMIFEIPTSVITQVDLIEYMQREGFPANLVDIFVDLFIKFKGGESGTIVYGRSPNYEQKDIVLSDPQKIIQILEYVSNFVKLLKPRLKIFVNGVSIKLDPELEQFKSSGIKERVEKVQIVTTDSSDDIEITRRIDVWALESSRYPKFQIIHGGIPIQMNYTRWNDNRETSTSGLNVITSISPEYRYEGGSIELHDGLYYHYIVNCDWIDLNIGRDKIIENESYTVFKTMLAEAMMKINAQLLPLVIRKEKKYDQDLSGIFTDRIAAFRVYNSLVLQNNQFELLIENVSDLPFFPVLYASGEEKKTTSISLSSVLAFNSIYFLPEYKLEKIPHKTRKLLMEMTGKSKTIALLIKTWQNTETYFYSLNVFAKQIVKNELSVYVLDPTNEFRIPSDLDFEVERVSTIDYNEYVENTKQPDTVFEKEDVRLSSVDRKVVRVAEEITNFLFKKLKSIFKKAGKAITGWTLAGLINRESSLTFSPEEEKTLLRFFKVSKIDVKIIELPDNIMGIWYPGKFEVGNIWLPAWLGINKRCKTYLNMIDMIDHELELTAYLSSLIAHEIAHEESIKILIKHLTGEQSQEHYSQGFVNAREVTQDFAGEYLAQILKEKLAKEDVEPFPAFCKQCGKQATYQGSMTWKCIECGREMKPPQVFRVILKKHTKKAEKLMKK